MLVTTKLSDGTVLPAGSIFGFNSFQINYDTQLWENPEKFDGFRYVTSFQSPPDQCLRFQPCRFERLRAVEGNDHKYQVRIDNFGAS